MDFFSRSLLSILSAGPIPQHIGIVMDGNRRYARRSNRPVQEGHDDGFKTLKRVLETCLRLHVKCVSVYSFSIENFKRPKEEVDALMNLAKEKLLELCNEGELLAEYGVRLNVIGKRSLLPQDVQDAVAKAERLTESHDRAILNVCMPYTSRDEITSAIQSIVQLHQDGDLSLENITEAEIEPHLATNMRGSPPLDMLIRTSGVKRLSDFLLWQTCDNTQIHFTPTYWPEFGLWEFIPMLFSYQREMWSRRAQAKVVS